MLQHKRLSDKLKSDSNRLMLEHDQCVLSEHIDWSNRTASDVINTLREDDCSAELVVRSIVRHGTLHAVLQSLEYWVQRRRLAQPLARRLLSELEKDFASMPESGQQDEQGRDVVTPNVVDQELFCNPLPFPWVKRLRKRDRKLLIEIDHEACRMLYEADEAKCRLTQVAGEPA